MDTLNAPLDLSLHFLSSAQPIVQQAAQPLPSVFTLANARTRPTTGFLPMYHLSLQQILHHVGMPLSEEKTMGHLQFSLNANFYLCWVV
ncbi:hypothetical protein CRENBAI_008826 [Crenichthys baileyi]|uniref:Uncharacterized protein n=1 Tax=Crenichthys baileyi TaxID=28760 RepID=A0AAV9QTN8_9TELE